MELRRYASIFWRWLWLIALGGVLAAGASFAVSMTMPRVYEASTTLLVNQSQNPGVVAYNDILTNERLTRTYGELIRKRPVLEQAIKKLQLPYSVEQLGKMVSTRVIRDTTLLELTAESTDPRQAAEMANAVAEAFIEQWPESMGFGKVAIAEPAVEPDAPVRPKVAQNVLLAALVGLMLAAGVALLLEYLDDTVKSGEDVARLLGVPTLGHVVQLKGSEVQELAPTAKVGSQSPVAEAFRSLRTNLQFSMLDRPGNAILVTSAGPGEGKSTMAANLAAVMAQAGMRVVLVDADLRRPSLHRAFGLKNSQGLTTALLRSGSLEGEVLQPGGVNNLVVITTGPLPPNPSELLGSPRMAAMVGTLKGLADVVLFDAPPLVVADPGVLAGLVDGVLLVVDASATRSEALERAKDALDRAGASGKLVGAVLNRLTERSGSYHYYYYHHYYSDDGKNGKAGRGGGRLSSSRGTRTGQV